MRIFTLRSSVCFFEKEQQKKKQTHKRSQAAAGPAKGVTAACMEATYGKPGIRGTKPAAQTSSWSDVS